MSVIEQIPFAQTLEQLRHRARDVRASESELTRVREAVGLEGDAARAWWRRAWWGTRAGLAAVALVRARRKPELRRHIDPPDWSEVRRALSDGRGAIMVGAHVGPRGVARDEVAEAGFPLIMFRGSARLHVDRFDPRRKPESVAPVGDRAIAAKRGALAALGHLRGGGVIFNAIDGLHGERTVRHPFLNRPLDLRLGLPTLIRATGAPAWLYLAVWEGDRIRFRLDRLPEPRAESPDAWAAGWFETALGRLESLVRTEPENLRLGGPLWRIDEAGARE